MASPSPRPLHVDFSEWWSNLDLKGCFDTIHPHNFSILAVSVPVFIFLWLLISYITSPLKQYPGPFLAGWTNLWRMWRAYKGDYATHARRLHDKYGLVVRLAPNLLDIDIPELFHVIYGTDNKFLKSDLYKSQGTFVDGKVVYHLFSEVNPAIHTQMKRPVARHYSVTAVQTMEPLMDDILMDLLHKLNERFVKTARPCRFGDWLAYFAWGFLGMVTISTTYGYMEAGTDFDNSLKNFNKMVDYFGFTGFMPWTDRLLDKNPVIRFPQPTMDRVTRHAPEKIAARRRGEDKNYTPGKPDFLQYFLESMSTHPELVDDNIVVGYLVLNLLAGADTTAMIMRAVFYHVLKNPRVYAKLCAEVRSTQQAFVPVSNAQARAMPYLDAVIREALRLNAPVCMALERIVPPEGLRLPDGRFMPGGQIVGMNPYVLARNKRVFGEYAEKFNPDRWLRQDGEDDQQHRKRVKFWWDNAVIAFGGGSRVCIGKHLALMEIYIVVPTLLATFDIELDDPHEVWWTCQRWFYWTRGVVCRLRPRRD